MPKSDSVFMLLAEQNLCEVRKKQHNVLLLRTDYSNSDVHNSALRSANEIKANFFTESIVL